MSDRRYGRGIGEGGKTLSEIMEENDRLYRKTGCYAGITEPSLLKKDPVKGELFHSRIMSTLISGRETTKMISGSPYVREVAELCIGLYTPDGDNIAQSTGIQVHIRLMGDNIKWMIRKNYEEEVGIEDGDLFIANDPVISGMHAADVYDILPIFWKGKLVSWVCTVIMEMDVGAVSPGCMPTANVERGTDGLKFCCEKIGCKDQLRRDFEHKIELSLDMANIFLLNRKGAIAANIRSREEIKNIISEFGVNYYKKAIKELIELERRSQVARIRQRTVPGRYSAAVPIELPMAEQPVAWLHGKRDTIRLIPIKMDITLAGSIVLDFDGAGEWGWHPFNVTPNALWGGLSVTSVQTLCYDGRANLGSLLAYEVKELPVDSILNPSQIRRLATSTPWAPALDILSMWMHLLGSSYYLRGFREETFNWRSSAGWQMVGYDVMGTKRPLMWFGTGNFGPGATGVCDGVDCGGWLATPEVDLGNEEVWELFVPQLSMSRRLEPYSAGHGRFRSGLAIPTVFMLHRVKDCVASGVIGCGSARIVPNVGQFGGYPGGRRNTFLVRFDNLQERIAKRQPLLHELGDPAELERMIQQMGGKITDFGLIPPPMKAYDGDYLISNSASAGGLGDPIEREPARVKADLDDGLTTKWIAENIYCVRAEFSEKTKVWQIDDKATKGLRQAKRKERLSRAVPVEQWWAGGRQKLRSRDLDSQILEMYQSSMKMSQSFAKEFRDFWALPDDFVL